MYVGISLGEGILVRSGGILRKKNAFTLLELIVTIVITSILLATAILHYIDLRQNVSDGIAKGCIGCFKKPEHLDIRSACTRGNHRDPHHAVCWP